MSQNNEQWRQINSLSSKPLYAYMDGDSISVIQILSFPYVGHTAAFFVCDHAAEKWSQICGKSLRWQMFLWRWQRWAAACICKQEDRPTFTLHWKTAAVTDRRTTRHHRDSSEKHVWCPFYRNRESAAVLFLKSPFESHFTTVMTREPGDSFRNTTLELSTEPNNGTLTFSKLTTFVIPLTAVTHQAMSHYVETSDSVRCGFEEASTSRSSMKSLAVQTCIGILRLASKRWIRSCKWTSATQRQPFGRHSSLSHYRYSTIWSSNTENP